MKPRTAPLGDKNRIGATITQLRTAQGMTQKELMIKLQLLEVDINYSSLSKLEGQTRGVSGSELVALSEIFGIDPKDLLQP